MVAGGVRDHGHGQTTQDVLIHSRVKVGDQTCAYDTRFRVFASQRIERHEGDVGDGGRRGASKYSPSRNGVASPRS